MINKIDDIKGTTKKDMIIYLNTCECCKIHKKNKPFFYKIFNEYPINTDKYTNECDCKCRHFARDICREQSLYNFI